MQRVERRAQIGEAADQAEALDAQRQPGPCAGEGNQEHQRAQLGSPARALVQIGVGTHHQPGATMGTEHAQADHPGEQGERVQQGEERTLVGGAHQIVEAERQAEEQVAEGHAEQ